MTALPRSEQRLYAWSLKRPGTPRCKRRFTVPFPQIRSLGVAGLISLVAPPAWSCGYHDPSQMGLGMLNWSYPDALHVRTAVWSAEQRGVLQRPDGTSGAQPGSAAHALQAMQRLRATEVTLRGFKEKLTYPPAGGNAPALSVVLISSMLWTRLEVVNGAPELAVHVDGPRNGDVVMVTDAPVIEAITAGRLAPREARSLGLLRLYGDAAEVRQVEAMLASFEVSSPSDNAVR